MKLLLLLVSIVQGAQVVQPRRFDAGQSTTFARLLHPELLGTFLGRQGIKFAPPSPESRPISAVVLAEMLEQSSRNATVGIATFEQLMLKAAPRIAVVNTSLMVSAQTKLPGFSFLAPNGTGTSTKTRVTATSSSSKSHQTSSVTYTYTAEAGNLVVSLVIDGIAVNGTFAGQNSPFLPRQPYMPQNASTEKTYADLLGDSLWFYEQQRSGLLNEPNRVPWRNNSALHDGLDNHIDLTGGYFDAGDYIKCTFPLSATLSYLAYGAERNIDGFQAAGQLGYLDQMLRWGFDWLLKAHPEPSRLFVHVGDTEIDNAYWGGDQDIPEPRPSYEINADLPGTDASAGAAAAFAAGAVLYATRLQDPAYAQRLLDSASELFYFAESAPKALYQISVPQVASAYSSSDYGDELVWAALQLFRATGDQYYLERADYYAKHYSLADQAIGTPVDWDSKHGMALLLGAQLVAERAKAAYNYLGGLERYVDHLLTQHTTPGGLLWFSGSSTDSSLVEAINSAYVLFAYSGLPSGHKDLSRSTQATLLAQSQLDYVLGDNPAKRVYMTGATPASPANPQSAMASGGHSQDTMDNDPKIELRVLYGALVGGPSDSDKFEDKRSNYKQSEIALDYNALLTPLLAQKVAKGDTPFFASGSESSRRQR